MVHFLLDLLLARADSPLLYCDADKWNYYLSMFGLADCTKILFEHVYISYSQIHGAADSQPAAAVVHSTPGSLNSFLDNICIVDIVDTAPQAVVFLRSSSFGKQSKVLPAIRTTH